MSSLSDRQRGITPAIRAKVLEFPWCDYCGAPATGVDHIVPRSRGGGLDDENLAPACVRCNREKRDQTPEEWAASRRASGKPWPIPEYDARLMDLFNRGVVAMPSQILDSAGVREWLNTDDRYEVIRRHLIAARDVPLGTYAKPLALLDGGEAES